MAGNVREKNPDSEVLSARAGNDGEVAGRAATPFNAADILASVGEAAYVWDIGSDHLVWGSNAGEVLRADAAKISSGRSYAQLIDADSGTSRFDAVLQANERDQGHGVFYRTEYCIRPDPAAENKLWIEDCGRWLAGGGRGECNQLVQWTRIPDRRQAGGFPGSPEGAAPALPRT